MTFFTGDWFSDNFIMNDILEQIQFYSGGESTPLQLNKSKGSGRMLYGYTFKGFLKWNGEDKIFRTESPYKGLYKTKVMDLHPELAEVFKEFANIYFPGFEYDSVQMTKNFLIKRHRDKANIGDSYICGFGNYKGGYLVIEKIEEELKKGELAIPTAVDLKDRPYRFNGYNYYHWNLKFTGTRYVLVFFKQHKKLELRD
jgi:hypothetical protein